MQTGKSSTRLSSNDWKEILIFRGPQIIQCSKENTAGKYHYTLGLHDTGKIRILTQNVGDSADHQKLITIIYFGDAQTWIFTRVTYTKQNIHCVQYIDLYSTRVWKPLPSICGLKLRRDTKVLQHSYSVRLVSDCTEFWKEKTDILLEKFYQIWNDWTEFLNSIRADSVWVTKVLYRPLPPWMGDHSIAVVCPSWWLA